MPDKIYIGWDNGSTGSVAMLFPDNEKGPVWFRPPVKRELDYTKKRTEITRLDVPAMVERLQKEMKYNGVTVLPVFMVMERPFTGAFWKQAMPALRFAEAQIITMEELRVRIGLPVQFEWVDSKQWQSEMLPSCTLPKRVGKLKKLPTAAEVEAHKEAVKKYKQAAARHRQQLKDASFQVGKRLFPNVDFKEDADSLLMAEWARRKGF